jgi:hypothetical protein
MEATPRFELGIELLQSSALPAWLCRPERVAGIGPAHQPWEGRRLPLHHTRMPARPFLARLGAILGLL